MPSGEELSEKVRQWAVLKAQSDTVTARLNRLRDELMAKILADGDRDEKGNSTLAFSSPVVVGDKQFHGLKREARTSTTLDEDAAIALAQNKGLQDEIIRSVPQVDVDALYAAWQRGKISEAELDSLFVTKTSFAFKPDVSS